MRFTGLVALALLLCPIAFSQTSDSNPSGVSPSANTATPPLKCNPPLCSPTAAELRKLLNHAGRPAGRYRCCSHAQSEE
jgi:hypothetical protein